jgi:arylsulfatase A-like enzyme
MYLPLEERSMATALKTAGYTSASIGKWHLGNEAYYPEKHGFDLNLAGCFQGQPPSYFSPYGIPTLKDGPAGEYLTDREAEEAAKFIEKNQDHPFYLYLPFHAVHMPLQAKKEVIAKYKKRIDPASLQTNATYAALIEGADDGVGTVLRKLDELKLTDRTVVIFNSDNGGLSGTYVGGQRRTTGPTDNSPLRMGKGSEYEGGVRVPLIVRWPGVVKAGSQCDTPVISPDYYPTLLAITGATPAPGQIIDGESIVPLLKQSGSLKRDTIYWHYPHYHPGGATPYGAIRKGDFKLIEFYEDNHVELYNLKNDIGEKNDLAKTMPDKAGDLRIKLAAWRKEVGAQMPTPNPNFDAVKDIEPPGAKGKKGKKAAEKTGGEDE